MYRLSLHLREEKPYEILTVPGHRAGASSADTHGTPEELMVPYAHLLPLPPGAVAFALAACRDREAVSEFMGRFRVDVVRDGDRLIAASHPAAAEILLLEGLRVERFIATCLLVPPPPWAEGVPPSQRVVVFFFQGESEEVLEHVRRAALAPTTGLRQILDPHTAKGKAALARLEEARQKKNAAPGILRRELAQRRTFTWEYTADTIQAVVWLELLELARENVAVKACRNRKCRRYFVPVPGNVAYCPTCRKNNSIRQALYYHRKKEAIAREGRTEEVKRQRREYMRQYRQQRKRRSPQ